MEGTWAQPLHLVLFQPLSITIDTSVDSLVHSTRFGRFILASSSSYPNESNHSHRRHTAALEQMRHRHALQHKKLDVLRLMGAIAKVAKSYVRRCTDWSGLQSDCNMRKLIFCRSSQRVFRVPENADAAPPAT